MKQRKLSRRLILGIICIVLLLAFIWSNSMKSIESSQSQSDVYTNLLLRILQDRIDPGTASHIVRKTAHFVEYAALGMAAGLMFFASGLRFRRGLYALLLSLGTAITDECIQLFYERGAQVSDVMLDFAGAIFGLGLYLAGHKLYFRLRSGKQKIT